MKALKPTSPKKGDIILYETPKGKVKQFLVGSRLWYGKRECPSRGFEILRNGKRYRFYTVSEAISNIFKSKKIAKSIRQSVCDENPLYKMIKPRKEDLTYLPDGQVDWKTIPAIFQVTGGREIATPLDYTKKIKVKF